MPGSLPVPCRSIFPVGPGKADGLFRCLAGHGYRTVVSYQPAGRYWVFQGIESAIFVALAGLLILLAVRLVVRRDA